ncbi:Uncharacterised protein [Mycobacterium tuberculosis]|nr:Uncharacterised protein [Mycobacterium tuberculosis]CSH70226.1 Uncharacterised protein [Shigella sonnei]
MAIFIPATWAAKMEFVSRIPHSMDIVVAITATAERRLTPRLTSVGNKVTISNIPRPEALVINCAMIWPMT